MLASIILALASGPSVQRLDELRSDLRPFLDAIATVESRNNDHAVGDNGRAIGRYQIWQVYWQDAYVYAPTIKGTYQDVKSQEYAERVMVAYFLRYAKSAVIEHDYEKLARIHNGGPNGHKKRATLPYWNRVRASYICPFCGDCCLTIWRTGV